MTRPGPAGWTVVMPVKRLESAKSRLDLPPGDRRALALAMALDSAAAALSAPSVDRLLVITADDEASAALRAMGAQIVPDPPRPGLNPAVLHGFGFADGAPIAALAADLPALRAAELESVLGRVTGVAVIADRAGTGTTLLAAASGNTTRPRFGRGSRQRHLADGAADLSDSAGPGLRTDVDTLIDLAVAASLGLGQHSAGQAARCLS